MYLRWNHLSFGKRKTESETKKKTTNKHVDNLKKKAKEDRERERERERKKKQITVSLGYSCYQVSCFDVSDFVKRDESRKKFL